MKNLLTLLLIFLYSFSSVAQDWDDLYHEIEASIQEPRFKDKTFLITDFGASPFASAAKNQKAINRAIEKCSGKGGGRVVVPAGRYLSGAICLMSNVNLVVEKDATLEFAFAPELYPIVKTRWEGLDCWNLSPCIYAYEAVNVAITGEGTIDGGGTNDTWWKWCGSAKYGWKEGTVSQRNGSRARLLKMAEDGVDADERRFGAEDGLRPQLINFNLCENILIENVTLLRSPFWVIHPLLSKNVTVRGVHINNDGPNGDGCDPESCDGVLIEKCYFNTGDDCIAIKSGRNNDGRLWNRPSQNIIVRDCEMRNGHGGVVIGSEISGGCRNVFAQNCIMDSPNLDRVVRIKTNTCRGGLIENIYARNIKVGQCGESVLKINLDYEHNEICCRGYIPTVRNVNLENVTCDKSRYGVQIIALDTVTSVYDINVANCQLNNVAEGNYISGKTRDISFSDYYLNGSLCLRDKPYRHYSEWMTASEMKRTPRSYMLDFAKKPKWSYVMGIELEAMLDTYLRYGNKDILDYCREYTDTMISPSGQIRGYQLEDYNLDNVRTGHFVGRMYQLLPEPKNRLALATLMKQMAEQPRTKEGVYWHKAIYAWQVWLDGIFMGLPVSTMMAPEFLDGKATKQLYDDAVDQVLKTYQRTIDPATGLNRHAWDETREMFWADSVTGLSQHCWGRAQGWYAMALIELLDALPSSYERRGEVADLLNMVLNSVVKWQDPASGTWWQVMDSPGRACNYLESTASSMFAYALLKAYRKGYASADKRDAGIKAYRGIINNFIKVNQDSTLSLTQCCSVAGLGPGISAKVLEAAPRVKENRRRDGSYDYYLSEKIHDNDAKGLGPFIWASLEMERLGYNTLNISQPIDRQALVSRNNPKVVEVDTLASLTVGNGRFAATVDATGLQSYPEVYKNGIPLTTMSEWAWHSFPNVDSLRPEETQRSMDLGHGHEEIYAVEYKEGGRQQEATLYFRENPHRLNLGVVGLEIKDIDGRKMELEEIDNLNQELQLWDGKIETRYEAFGQPVEVTAACMQKRDCFFGRVKSPLLAEGRACVTLSLPYPTGRHADDAADWVSNDKHKSTILDIRPHEAVIEHRLDSTIYYINVRWEGDCSFSEVDAHKFNLSTVDNVLTFAVEYSPTPTSAQAESFSYDQALKACLKGWMAWWKEGAVADFSECTDPRARELERRVVQSQYLTKANCASSLPPQETGLTYNTWFGRPHLEMAWWHGVHFALWNRPDVIGQWLDWYDAKAYPEALKIANRQGFKGARWMKMTDPEANEAPSNTGSFLIWQQPHFIYFAEEAYRANPSLEVLSRHSAQVEATAEFMADWALSCSDDTVSPIRLKGATAMQESMSKGFSYCHPFEQAYWKYGLETAQRWRERQGLPRKTSWDQVISRLAPLAEKDGLYIAGLPKGKFIDKDASDEFDPFVSQNQEGEINISRDAFDLKSHSDHPAVIAPAAMIPDTGLYSDSTMTTTYRSLIDAWNWPTTWGWDYGMLAMAAARLGLPSEAVEALLTDKGKNTYLLQGHNFQEPRRLRLYLPGNGALLAAVAMMCAGWDGCTEVNNPGFPADGTWNVRWEGFRRAQ